MAENPVRTALHARLTADVPLEALVGERIFFQKAPQGATYPLVVFHKQSGTPRWAFAGTPLNDDLWTVKGIAVSAATAENIADAIDDCLQDAALAVTGRTLNLKPQRASDVDYAEDDGGTIYRHCGAMYRLVTE